MNERYSQGIMFDGPVILDNSSPMSPEYIVESLNEKDEEIAAAAKLCEIYFNIAANVIGEDEVIRLRDEQLPAPPGDKSCSQRKR